MTEANCQNLQYSSPSPEFPILKAMESAYADALVHGGQIRMYLNSYYRTIEQQSSRDTEEGIGILNCRGRHVRTQGFFSTFLWCTSQAKLSPDEVARKYQRDTVVVIEWPHILAERLLQAAYDFGSQWALECRPVVYDKGSFRDRDPEDEDDSDPEYYIFQKSPRLSRECEYRYALTDLEGRQYGDDFIDLKMRSCQDIMQIYRREVPSRACRLQMRRRRVGRE